MGVVSCRVVGRGLWQALTGLSCVSPQSAAEREREQARGALDDPHPLLPGQEPEQHPTEQLQGLT